MCLNNEWHQTCLCSVYKRLGTRSMANRYSDQKLTKQTDKFIRNNINDVLISSQIHKFPRLQVQIVGK